MPCQARRRSFLSYRPHKEMATPITISAPSGKLKDILEVQGEEGFHQLRLRGHGNHKYPCGPLVVMAVVAKSKGVLLPSLNNFGSLLPHSQEDALNLTPGSGVEGADLGEGTRACVYDFRGFLFHNPGSLRKLARGKP